MMSRKIRMMSRIGSKIFIGQRITPRQGCVLLRNYH